jgi:hypothetical protein
MVVLGMKNIDGCKKHASHIKRQYEYYVLCSGNVSDSLETLKQKTTLIKVLLTLFFWLSFCKKYIASDEVIANGRRDEEGFYDQFYDKFRHFSGISEEIYVIRGSTLPFQMVFLTTFFPVTYGRQSVLYF